MPIMFTEGMKKVLLMINPLFIMETRESVRFSTHLAGDAARLVVIVDDHKAEPKPMASDRNGPLAGIDTSFSTGSRASPIPWGAAAKSDLRRPRPARMVMMVR